MVDLNRIEHLGFVNVKGRVGNNTWFDEHNVSFLIGYTMFFLVTMILQKAHYTRLSSQINELDFCDTVLNFDHLKNSFPGHRFKCTTEDQRKRIPPFRLTFPKAADNSKKRKDDTENKEENKDILVEPYVIPNRGPYPYIKPKMNTVSFTATQIEASQSGMQPGLTMVRKVRSHA